MSVSAVGWCLSILETPAARPRGIDMRFVHLYLIGYVLLVIGIALALWQTGLLNDIAPIWVGIGVTIAVGVGIMLSVSSGRPTITEESEK